VYASAARLTQPGAREHLPAQEASPVQGCLAHKKQRPPRTLQYIVGPCLEPNGGPRGSGAPVADILFKNGCMGLDWSTQCILMSPRGGVATRRLPRQNCMNRARPVQTAHKKRPGLRRGGLPSEKNVYSLYSIKNIHSSFNRRI